jgi:CelD/BcsL family acetyltransferase involved in cellulose biosynthesis
LAETTVGLRLVFHDTPETIAQAFPVLVSLHKQRKTVQGIKSAFSRSDSLDFHARAALKLSESRSAFIATLESGKDAVSAAYCLCDKRNVYYFQTGLSPTGAELGAGSTLLYMLIRWAANHKYEWFDFLKGDEEYKKSWATDRVEQRSIRITRTTMCGQLALTMNSARRALKSLYDRNIRSKNAPT